MSSGRHDNRKRLANLAVYVDPSDLAIKYEESISQTKAVGGRRPAVSNEKSRRHVATTCSIAWLR